MCFSPDPSACRVGDRLPRSLFAPIMRDRLNAYFVIEPRDTHQVHAGVPGKILAVYVKEGDTVRNGQVIARLKSMDAAGASEEAAEQYRLHKRSFSRRSCGIPDWVRR